MATYMFMRNALGKRKQHRVALCSHTEEAGKGKLLIKYGASEMKDTLGFTPLFYACGRAAKLLLFLERMLE